ncbi:hypothetical protein [Aeromonas enteropelogenes]|uniref:hypothetical protein n=1 Tax=Aeromonas enteropelogenes TaxID=29489 RepID=UPI003B9E5AA2
MKCILALVLGFLILLIVYILVISTLALRLLQRRKEPTPNLMAAIFAASLAIPVE